MNSKYMLDVLRNSLHFNFGKGTIAALVFVGAVFILALPFGVPPIDVTKYFLYHILYILFPGLVIYSLAGFPVYSGYELIVKSWVLGICVEMLVGLIAVMSDLKELYPYIIFLYIFTASFHKRNILSTVKSVVNKPANFDAIILVLLATFFIFANSSFNFNVIVDQHFTWTAAFSNVSVNSWPISEPFILGIPLNYHYLFNIHVGLSSYVFDIPTINIASRLSLISHPLLFLAIIHVFCIKWFRSSMVGLIAVVQIMMIFGYSQIFWQTFHSATPTIMIKVPSTIVAFQVFVLIVDCILNVFKEKQTNFKQLLLIVVLIFVSSGIRAMFLPVLLGGLGLLFLRQVFIREKIASITVLLSSAVGSIIFGLWFFYGLGASSDGTKMLFLSPLNLAVSQVSPDKLASFVNYALAAGLQTHVTSAAYLMLALCGRLTFLLPGVLFFLWQGNSNETNKHIKLLLGGVAIAGLLVLVFIESTIPQEVWAFYWYSDIGLSIMGAAGTVLLWQQRAQISTIFMVSATYASIFFGVQAVDFTKSFIERAKTQNFSQPSPRFSSNPILPKLIKFLKQTAKKGDIIVTGGKYEHFDERVLPASIPGVQLFAHRQILKVYLSRIPPDQNVVAKQFLLNNRMKNKESLLAVKRMLDKNQNLYLLWIGDDKPVYSEELHFEHSFPGVSIWSIR